MIGIIKALRMWKKFIRNEDGLTAGEYALLWALMTIALVASQQFLGGAIRAIYNQVAAIITV